MANFTDELIEQLLPFDAQLTRLEAAEALNVRRRIGKLETDIVRLIGDLNPDRLELVLKRLEPSREIAVLIKDAYDDVAKMVDSDTLRLATLSSRYTVRVLNEALAAGNLLQPPAPERLRAASDLVVEGRPAQEWWDRQETNLRRRFGREVREGLADEETIPDVVRRIRGTRENRFKDGIFSITRHDAMTLARTSVFSVSNDARLAVFERNRNLLRGHQAVNPLDQRTSDICKARAGKAWMANGQPMEGTAELFPGAPPWHFRCRTILAPIFNPVSEMTGLSDARRERLQGVGAGRRLDGKPADGIEFGDWFGRQSEAAQRDMLGKVKFGLWKRGRIGFPDLIDQSGNSLTIGELERLFV